MVKKIIELDESLIEVTCHERNTHTLQPLAGPFSLSSLGRSLCFRDSQGFIFAVEVMDSNKDEALKCIGIAKEAIASGNKEKALKFIKIGKRLDGSLSVDDLVAACEKLDSGSAGPSQNGNHEPAVRKRDEAQGNAVNGEQNYTEEHVQLIRQINKHKDYYAVLGVEKTCSVEEVRKAYRKLSLKVHPDKNKAPGSEEAFKKVSKAFKCLSEEESRRQYDQTGPVEDYEYNQQHNVRRRRRATNDFYDDEFDPDEIFRAFFGQTRVFGNTHVFRTGGMGPQNRAAGNGGQPSPMILLQLLPFLVIVLLAYLPFSEPVYSLQKNYSYPIPRVTERYGVEFYVKSVDFDRTYPVGSAARINIEDNVIEEYKNLLRRYCHIELQRRQWSRNMPTPHCDKLQSLGTDVMLSVVQAEVAIRMVELGLANGSIDTNALGMCCNY
ncbi:Chaperone protein dnaJ 49-like protein [Drosera capensis]